MRSILRIIDSVNGWLGPAVLKWLVVALVATGLFDVIMRYVFSTGIIWIYETMLMLGGTIIILGWGYVHLHQANIRVDLFFARLSPRGKATVDVLGTVIFFFPLFTFFTKSAISHMWEAWVTNEKMMYSFWYPSAVPFRAVIVIGCLLVFLQFIAQFIRDLHMLTKGKPL